MATHSSIPCLGNPMDRGAQRAIVHGVTEELDTTQQLKKKNIPYTTLIGPEEDTCPKHHQSGFSGGTDNDAES